MLGGDCGVSCADSGPPEAVSGAAPQAALAKTAWPSTLVWLRHCAVLQTGMIEIVWLFSTDWYG